MSKFVEVLVDGLTVRGQVRSAGDTVQVPEGFLIQSKRKQVARWGHPKLHEISRDDHVNRGGQVLENDPVPPAGVVKEPAASEAQETPEDDSGGEVVEPAAPFEALFGLGVEDTLEAVRQFGEDELAQFVSHEIAGENRSGVLGPLGAE